MNVINAEIRAIQNDLALTRKDFRKNPHDKKLKAKILMLEKELDSRLEKVL